MSPEDLTEDVVVATIGPFDRWHHECHAASLRLVNSGLLPHYARVARGTLPGIGGQHSWVVVGGSCYEPTWIVDVTAWSYDERYPRLYVVAGAEAEHKPHGFGDVFTYGYPICGDGPAIDLAVSVGPRARAWLREVAKVNGRRNAGIDQRGWLRMANGPMQGWPASEVIEAMLDTPALAAFVPIDIAGMVTDRNPSGLYLASDAYEPEDR